MAKNTKIGLDVIYQIGESPVWVRTGPQLASWDITNQMRFSPGDTGALGDTSRLKLLRIDGLDLPEVRARLGS